MDEYANQLPAPRDQPRRPQGDYPVIVRLVHTDLSEEWGQVTPSGGQQPRSWQAGNNSPEIHDQPLTSGCQSTTSPASSAAQPPPNRNAMVDDPKLSDFGLSPRHFRLGPHRQLIETVTPGMPQRPTASGIRARGRVHRPSPPLDLWPVAGSLVGGSLKVARHGFLTTRSDRAPPTEHDAWHRAR